MKRYLFFFLCCLVSGFELQATHYMGANMYYDCISNNRFKLTVATYYDCMGGAVQSLRPFGNNNPPPAPQVNFQALTGTNCAAPTQIGAWRSVHFVDITPVCPGTLTGCNTNSPAAAVTGTLESLYETEYNFAGLGTQCTRYEVTWSHCCRNGIITSGADNLGIFLDGLVVDLGASPCNSSPRFLNPPIAYICAGAPAKFEHQAYDPDGDSLVYRLAPCYSAAQAPVTYNPGYSPFQPLGPSWVVNMDPATGDINLTPRPGGQEIGVLCVEVTEYRNGQALSTTARDIQIVVMNCQANNNPRINQLTVISGANKRGFFAMDGAVGVPLSFSVQILDPDVGDTLTSYFDTTNIPLPGLTYAVVGINPQNITANWTPPAPGRYVLRLVSLDQSCPLPSTSVRAVVVEVAAFAVIGNITNTPCDSTNGAIDLSVSGGSPPYQFQWSTGDTTEDIDSLASGSYTVLVIDQNGDSVSRSFFINGASLSLNPVIVDTSCRDGSSIQLNVAGGTPPYRYSWNTGDTTASLLGIQASAGYSVVVTDATGCTRNGAWWVPAPDSCFNVIQGCVFIDANGNCVQDSGEVPLPNVQIALASSRISVLTDNHGAYTLTTPFVGLDSIYMVPRPFLRSVCPPSGGETITFDSLGMIVDYKFAVQLDTVKDLAGIHCPARARPGRTMCVYLYARNDGSLPTDGTVRWAYDSIFTYTSSSPAFSRHDPQNRVLEWDFTNLLPGRRYVVLVCVDVDSTVGAGHPYQNTLYIDSIACDSFPANNVVVFRGRTFNSFDPNDKQASPTQRQAEGWILEDETMLTYTIRFQNTGTDTAFYVSIKDVLDMNTLDVSSLKMVGSSHPYQLFRILNYQVLEVRFDNILLPPESQDPDGSQGYITFTIDRKPNLAYGTEIRNSAAIYFDFNDPILTNTVLRTVYDDMIDEGPSSLDPCANGTTEVSVSQGAPPYTFYWPGGLVDANNATGVSIQPVPGTGPQQVRVVDAIGKETLIDFTLTPAPAPDADFTFAFSGNTTVDFEGQAGMKSYEWDFGDGNTAIGRSVSHTYASRGVYAVKHWAHNDCGTDTLTQRVDFAVGIPGEEFGSSVEVQPNPMAEQAIIRFANPAGQAYRLTLFDTRGSEVCRYPAIRGDHFLVRKGNLPAGIYLFQLEGPHRYYGRLVIK